MKAYHQELYQLPRYLGYLAVLIIGIEVVGYNIPVISRIIRTAFVYFWKTN